MSGVRASRPFSACILASKAAQPSPPPPRPPPRPRPRPARRRRRLCPRQRRRPCPTRTPPTPRTTSSAPTTASGRKSERVPLVSSSRVRLACCAARLPPHVHACIFCRDEPPQLVHRCYQIRTYIESPGAHLLTITLSFCHPLARLHRNHGRRRRHNYGTSVAHIVYWLDAVSRHCAVRSFSCAADRCARRAFSRLAL